MTYSPIVGGWSPGQQENGINQRNNAFEVFKHSHFASDPLESVILTLSVV